ncbi:hypothetical protein [Streptomyces ipomoeae]|uniref:hypothetical protein n=1 Tax=Streptomyces ipomoeae TaxID=103232 RepID=UPI0011479057|nr:hypothetical protein [Streptomyces ipomoeae]MDX2937212.1 hypothetical protein [Streptomyces ipomoeae]TQE28540.1 hypothetical protein SipoB123_09865 [Streptomyces ipomoeae]
MEDSENEAMAALVGQLKEADAELVAYHMADGEPVEQLVTHHRADGTARRGERGAIAAARRGGGTAGPAVAERDTNPSERGPGAAGRGACEGGNGKRGHAHIGGVCVARHLASLAAALGTVAVIAAPAPWGVVLGVTVIVVAFVGAPVLALVSGRREHGGGRRQGYDLVAGGAAAVIVTVVAALAAGQRK